MIQHRLPLFLRSDLYSEYKISKLLTSPVLGESFSYTGRQPGASVTETNDLQLQALAKHTGNESNTFNLPEISFNNSVNADISSVDDAIESARTEVVTHSKSDAEIESSRSARKLSRRVNWKRSMSVSPELLTSPEGANWNTMAALGGKMMRVKDLQFLSTKSGMSALWKFLKGKAGERNLLFWLDAERIKHFNKESDRQRYYIRDQKKQIAVWSCREGFIYWGIKGGCAKFYLLFLLCRLVKELCERYLVTGSPLELPAEAKVKVHLKKPGQLTSKQIRQLQDAMVTRLREYW